MKRGAYLLNLGATPYQEAWELQRALAGAVSQGAIPDTVLLLEHPPVITLGRRTDGRRAARPRRRRGRGRRDRPRRQVDLPRARASSSATRSSTSSATGGTSSATAATSRRRSSARSPLRHRGDADRGAHRRLARAPAAEDRLDRRPHLALGHDARLRAERRPRPGAVHGVDHGLRARGRGLHDASRASSAGRSRSTRCARSRRRRSRRSSTSSSRSSRPRTARPLGAAAHAKLSAKPMPWHPIRRGIRS